jgi:hypothetical protein
VFGRIQIQTNDVFQFLGEGGVVADFEGFHAMRFQTWACQMRRTLASLMPTAAAMVRVLQCWRSRAAGAWSWSQRAVSGGHQSWAYAGLVTEHSVRAKNAEIPSIREILVAGRGTVANDAGGHCRILSGIECGSSGFRGRDTLSMGAGSHLRVADTKCWWPTRD